MHADLSKVQQILSSLLSNAAKFTRDGSIVLAAERSAGASREEIRFTVQDTGIGMSQEQMEHIFDEFTQVDSSSTRKYGGTGLGLTISRHFCRLMDGAISVESEPGRGTTVIVDLPAQVVQPSLA
jgi:signal transduction histidine kinase